MPKQKLRRSRESPSTQSVCPSCLPPRSQTKGALKMHPQEIARPVNTLISEDTFRWAQVMCRYRGKSFALITSSSSCEICVFSSVQIKKCMLREKEICLRSCSQMSQTVIFFNPNWPGSRAHALELTDKKTHCLTQVWEKIEWGKDSQEEVQAVTWALGQTPVHWLRQFWTSLCSLIPSFSWEML